MLCRLIYAKDTNLIGDRFEIQDSCNNIINALNGFLDSDNIGPDTNMRPMCASHTEI
jgi:hypothetical protein